MEEIMLRYTKEFLAEVRERYARGETISSIARVMESPRETIRQMTKPDYRLTGKYKTYTLEDAEKVRAMVASGVSQNQTAKNLGINKSTIAKMLKPDYEGSNARKSETTQVLQLTDFWMSEKKCPTCGRVVRLPCLACHVDKDWEGKAVSVPHEIKEEPKLALEGEDASRFAKVKAHMLERIETEAQTGQGRRWQDF